MNTKGEPLSATTSTASYLDAENEVLSASNGVGYAYRTTGPSDAPTLVMLRHFRGNLDNWEPALVDALAQGRRVITFDDRGVAASSGTTPDTIAQMALDAIDFIDAREVGEVDLLGFSIGSFVAQEVALVRPSIVRNLVLASSARAECTVGRRRSSVQSETRRHRRPSTSASSSPAPTRAARRDRRPPAASSGRERSTTTRPLVGRPGLRNTTRCAPGGSPTTRCSNGSRRSTGACS
jgi:pimeloyl-ACP methyl ester carboxylesterase